MAIGAMLPAVRRAWKPRPVTQVSRLAGGWACRVDPYPADGPGGTVALEQETRGALTAAGDLARARSVGLQMALEPELLARVDAAEYRACLHDLLIAAIGRARGGVLVTAARQGTGVEVAVLDDGAALAEPPSGSALDDRAMPLAGVRTIPGGAGLTADYQPGRGTTVRLCLPHLDGRSGPRGGDLATDHAMSAPHAG